MAIVHIEGFDHLSGAQIAPGSSGPKSFFQTGGGYYDVLTGRFGSGQAFRVTNVQGGGQSGWGKALPSSYSEAFCGFAMKISRINDGEFFMRYLTSGGGSISGLKISVVNATGRIGIANAAGTVVATGSTVISPNTWHYIEIRTVVSASAGVIDVRIDGNTTSEVSASSLNTGSTNIGQIYFVCPSQGFGGAWIDVDDIYVLDTSGGSPRNTWLGECRIETIRPSTNGTTIEWTPSASTNASNVDDAGSYDSDTTYNSIATENKTDTFTMTSPYNSLGTVIAVQTNYVARKSDAGLRRMAPVIRHSGTDYVGTASSLTTSYDVKSQLYQQDPGGSDWNFTTIAADEFGYKTVV